MAVAEPPRTGWSEWDAVALLLAGIPPYGAKLIRFMDAEDHSIDWDRIEASVFSHAEVLLVALARNLWNSGESPSIKELVATLDDDNFARALRAIEISRSWRRSAGGAP